MVYRKMDRSKTYNLKSIVLVPKYSMLDFHEARSSRTWKCLSVPPLGRFWSYIVGQRVGLSKIYSVRSVLLVPIHIIFDLHWARSNRTRDILSARLWATLGLIWWAGGSAHRKYTLSNRFCSLQYTLYLSFFMELGQPEQTHILSTHLWGHSWS